MMTQEGLDHDPAAAHFVVLERNWRRVASTHTFQELLEGDKPAVDRGLDLNLVLLGVGLILIGMLSFAAACFTILILPNMPPSENITLRKIQEDRYYHLLVPITVPVTIVAIFVNWFSMKLFKHNS